MILKVNKDICEIKQNEVWNVGDYNVHTVQVELSPEFNGLVNKVRYFVEDNSYDMLITDNVAQVPYEATLTEGTIKIGVYGYDADTNILVQSTSPVNKYISSGTYTGEADNTQPLTPTDKEQMETAIQKNTNDITDLKANKQDKLISGVNIKTINNESILSSGNLTLVAEETDPIFTNSPAYSITDNDITYWNNKANMSDIPDVSNFITKDVDDLTYYTKSTDMQTAINNAVSTERTARENADNSLQNQIDAITVSSDVVDVVSTYQDLVDYDTQHIKANDIIKVMQDSTHDNAISYYRWVIVNHVGSWEYVGSEGPYYTKSETDTLLNAKQNTLFSGQNIKTINNESLLGEGNINIQSGGTSDYEDLENLPKVNNVELKGNKTLNDLGIQPVGNYALESEMIEAQNDIDHLSTVTNLFEKITRTGTSVTLNDTSNTIMKLNLDTTTSSQETTTGKNLLPSTLTSQTINGVTVTRNSDGSITLNGTTNANTDFKWFEGEIQLEAGTYYIGLISTSSDFNLYSIGSNGTNIIQNPVNNPYTTLTLASNTTFTRLSSYVYSGKTFNNETFYPIICKELPVEYEPYTGGQPAPSPSYPQPVHTISGDNAITISNSDNTKSQEYPINLGDIEICKIGDYQDYFYKNNGKWYLHKEIGKVILDENSTISVQEIISSNNKFIWRYTTTLNMAGSGSRANILSNYYIGDTGVYGANDKIGAYVNSTSLTNFATLLSTIGATTSSTTSQVLKLLKTWLTSNNVTLYYPLATPTYTLLNDTIQTQLNNIQYALAYDTQTNISQTNNDLPFIINAETYAKIGGGGTSDYTNLTNKPKINNVELNGNKSLNDLGIQPAGNYALESEIPDVSNFITKDVNNLTNYTLKTNTGSLIDLEINDTTYVVTLKLKNQDGTVISTDTIDLPLESVVVSGRYDNTTKKVILTLENGSEVDFSVADLVAGLQTEITSSNKLASDLVDDTNSGNKFVTTSEKQTWNNKLDQSDLTDYATKTYVNNLFNSIVDGDEVSY